MSRQPHRCLPALAILLLAAACRPNGNAASPPIAPAAAPSAAQPASPPAPATTASPSPAAEPANPAASNADAFVLPGVLTANTGIEDLRRIFGAANVRSGEFPGAEGATYRGVELFAGDPTRRAIITFEDPVKSARIATVRVEDAGSRWTLGSGVHIGMPLAELQRLNGKPVRFLGFDWDYGGHVVGWHDGTLAKPAPGHATYSVQLAHEAKTRGNDYPMGDGEFDSGDKRWPRLGEIVHVSAIGIAFPGRDDL